MAHNQRIELIVLWYLTDYLKKYRYLQIINELDIIRRVQKS